MNNEYITEIQNAIKEYNTAIDARSKHAAADRYRQALDACRMIPNRLQVAKEIIQEAWDDGVFGEATSVMLNIAELAVLEAVVYRAIKESEELDEF